MKKYNYLFIAFSGEEMGLLGSAHFVKKPTIKLNNVACMLNFDMVGRLDSFKKTMMVYGIGTSPVWPQVMEKVKNDTSLLKIKTTLGGTGASDHTSFYYQNLPVLHFFTGQHYDYHMPEDDEIGINYGGMVLVYQYVYSVLEQLQTVGKMEFTPTKNDEEGRASFKVTLGIMPDYVFDGIGVKVDGVNQGRPGHAAGLQKGDIIIKLGDIAINTMNDYMKALGSFAKGDETEMEVIRGGETIKLKVKFE